MKIRAIVTGATGMVGEGVLHQALRSPDVESVLVLGRRPCEVVDPKLREIVHADFHNLAPIISPLSGYNACFFCLGVSSVGMTEEAYTRSTYDLTLNVATVLAAQNPDMTFCYVSGEGTDSTEKGKLMWARVKGRTENAVARLPFKDVYLFRPGAIRPMAGMKRTLKLVKWFAPLFPVIQLFAPGHICKLEDIGSAMIRVARSGYPKKILNSSEIGLAAKG